MNLKIKTGVLVLFIFLKLAFFWDVGYSYVVLIPAIVWLLIALIAYVPGVIKSANIQSYYKKKRTPSNDPEVREEAKQDLHEKQELKRKDLSNFFMGVFILPFLVNLMEYLSVGELLIGRVIMSNAIFVDIVYIVIILIVSVSTKIVLENVRKAYRLN